MAQWCNPLTLKPEQSGGMGSSPGRTPSLERHDKGWRTRSVMLYFCDPGAWQLHLHFVGYTVRVVSGRGRVDLKLLLLKENLYTKACDIEGP